MIRPSSVRSTHLTWTDLWASADSFMPNFTVRGIDFGAGWAGANSFHDDRSSGRA
jgi:hypothetical protein